VVCSLLRTLSGGGDAVKWGRRQTFDIADNAPYRADMAERLAERLAQLREKQVLSLSEVARRAQISKAYLSQLEHGESKQPSYEVLDRLATALGTSMELLTGRSGSWDPSVHEPVPPSLRAFATQLGLPNVDVEMLAKIHYRGKRPRDPADWAHLYETIKRTIR
jgi:transcriptional regulator with XRE-family HTH domain